MNRMLSLTSTRWAVFDMNKVFNIKDGYYNKRPPEDKNGDVPFLSATQSNNGITGYYHISTILKWDKVGDISEKNLSERIFEGNCIAITNNGSVGCAFYQENSFTCSHDVTPVYLRNYTLNKDIAMFLIPLLEKAGQSFGYGKKWRPKRMRKSKLLLPVDDSNQPNWIFMEQFIKQEQKKVAQQVIDYYEPKMLETAYDLVGLEEVEWKVFPFNKIFKKIQRGKRLKKADHIVGDTPYVSSTSINNGVDGFIGNEDDVRRFSNNLSIANSGSVGFCFYHEYEYIASDHVTSLSIDGADKNIYLFMSTIVRRLEEKYSFNREINDKRIRQEKIILPVDENGNPHWKYMSKFVQKLEDEKLQEVLEYIYIG